MPQVIDQENESSSYNFLHNNITEYLDDIESAEYGATVRSAIVNALSLSYANVTSAYTIAEDVLTRANEILSVCVSETDRASDAADVATNIANSFNSEWNSAENYITTFRNNMEQIGSTANNAKNDANKYKSDTYLYTYGPTNSNGERDSDNVLITKGSKQYYDAVEEWYNNLYQPMTQFPAYAAAVNTNAGRAETAAENAEDYANDAHAYAYGSTDLSGNQIDGAQQYYEYTLDKYNYLRNTLNIENLISTDIPEIKAFESEIGAIRTSFNSLFQSVQTMAGNASDSETRAYNYAYGSVDSGGNVINGAQQYASSAETYSNDSYNYAYGYTNNNQLVSGAKQYAEAAASSVEDAISYADSAYGYAYGVRNDNNVVVTNGAQQYYEAVQDWYNGLASLNIRDLVSQDIPVLLQFKENVERQGTGYADAFSSIQASINQTKISIDGDIETISNYVASAAGSVDAAGRSAEVAYTYAYGVVDQNDNVVTKGAQQYAKEANDAMTSIEEDRGDIEQWYNELMGLNISTLVSSDIPTIRAFMTSVTTPESGYADTFSSILQSAQEVSSEISSIQTTINTMYGDISTWYTTLQNGNYPELISRLENADTDISQMEADILAAQENIRQLDTTYIEESIETMRGYSEAAVDAKEENERNMANLSDLIASAETAANDASQAATTASQAATNLNNITSNWNSIYYPQYNSIISEYVGYQDMVAQVLSDLNTSKLSYDDMYESASSYVAEWQEMRTNMSIELDGAAAAVAELENAANSIENMTVTSESVNYNVPGSVEISDEDGHKNIHFYLQKGEPGSSNIIKGGVYASLSALEEDITDPEVGDQYNVGTTTPYNIYRWTGEEWEDQGPYGVSIEKIINTEIDQIYSGTAVAIGGKYLDMAGLIHYTTNKVKPAIDTKVDKVTGKALSTNDFTDAYKSQLDNLDTRFEAKVNKDGTKVLSDYNFSTTYRSMLVSNNDSITSMQTSKLNTAFDGYTEISSSTDISDAVIPIRSGSTTYKITASSFASKITYMGGVIGTDYIPTLAEARTYIGISA